MKSRTLRKYKLSWNICVLLQCCCCHNWKILAVCACLALCCQHMASDILLRQEVEQAELTGHEIGTRMAARRPDVPPDITRNSVRGELSRVCVLGHACFPLSGHEPLHSCIQTVVCCKMPGLARRMTFLREVVSSCTSMPCVAATCVTLTLRSI